MRHLGSALLALLLAPLGLVLAGRGLGGLAEVASEAPQAEQTDYFAIITASASLGLAGLVVALLTMTRLSPVGPVLAGAGYLYIGVWALQDPEQLLDTVPSDLIGLNDGQLAAAATVAPLLAVPLLVTVFIPRRWRGRDRSEPAGNAVYGKQRYRPPGLAAPSVAAPAPTLVAGPLPRPLSPLPRPLSPLPRPLAPPPPPPPRPAPPPAWPPQAPPPQPAAVPAGDDPTDVLPSDEPTVDTSSSEPTVTAPLPSPDGNPPLTGR